MKTSFLGDISLNENYIELYKKGVNPFYSAEDKLKQSDYVVGNLECMANGAFGENELKKPRLTTTVEALNYLKNINLSVACLAQNHVYDHLEDGFKNTTDFLIANDIKFLGASFSTKVADNPIILTKNGIRIGLLNYVTEDTNPNLPSNAGVSLNVFNIDKCISDITNLKKSVHHVVLSLHWGGRVEGGLYPDWNQPMIARRLVDNGADLIIGHHSHTVQPFEIYKGKYIFYSLGNFCFSDFTFEGEKRILPKRRLISMLVKCDFDVNSYNIELSFFKNNKGFLKPYDIYKKRLFIRNRMYKMLFKFNFLWNIYFIYQKKYLTFVLYLFNKRIALNDKITKIVNKLWKYILS